MSALVLLTIAGFDPSSGAGVTADLSVFAAHGFFGTACITALTVQSTRGVFGSAAVDAETVADTLQRLGGDLPAAGVKIGMLANAANVHAVCSFLRDAPSMPMVVDPVILSTSGRELLDPAGVAALRDELLPLATWVTPNVRELAQLTGLEITDAPSLEVAARTIKSNYPRLNVVVTGGEADGVNPDSADDLVLAADGSVRWLRGLRVKSSATHGTGCAFSSALLCGLVSGAHDAPGEAKAYVTEAIRSAPPLGGGKGPMNLLWPLEKRR